MSSSFNEEDLATLMHLCRIDCSKEEKNKLYQNLSRILSYVDQLRDVDTTDVDPCKYVCDVQQSVYREDEIHDLLSQSKFLENAPSQVGGMIKVPPVINFKTKDA